LVAITAPLMKKNDGMDKNERIASRRRFSWSAAQAVQMILEMRTLKPDERLAQMWRWIRRTNWKRQRELVLTE
jgi:hypothetical protein